MHSAAVCTTPQAVGCLLGWVGDGVYIDLDRGACMHIACPGQSTLMLWQRADS